MGDTKQVKVDNWGAFFLQRLKHFFNRTDYCDLTLQFQDNAQLKVHRLVLNACTEYFELLERTCEMYEDCLIMPDDLQADVVVPIVNFMYTGQLEYKYELLNKLYQTAQIMNMSVLTKLLDVHRHQPAPPPPPKSTPVKYKQHNSYSRPAKATPSTSQKKFYIPPRQTTAPVVKAAPVRTQERRSQKYVPARPTRYELPEELDKDGIFEDSFSSLSYESRPLMTHPAAESSSKSYSSYESPRAQKFEELRKLMKRPSTSTADVAEFKRLRSNQSNLFGDSEEYVTTDEQLDDPFDIHQSAQQPRQTQDGGNQLFDHVIEMQGAKVTIEAKSQNENSVDHAKIISEVLKKYPHLVKNNKNIKLKIVNSPKSEGKSVVNRRIAAQSKRSASPLMKHNKNTYIPEMKTVKKEKDVDFVYETDITDTKEVGRLIALGVENVKGPWICLICGTPGKALHFTSYHKFRNHLVDVHNERPPSNMCQFCGLKSGKRNHLLHHIYTKHGVPPPPSYHFPKCNQCSYIALTQAFLIKHKMTHTDIRFFTCNVCQKNYKSSTQLLHHIQETGHKICAERKSNLQCIYCMKVFLRESNLYAHLKTAHRSMARHDGIIDYSDEDEDLNGSLNVKREPVASEEMDKPEEEYEQEEEEMQYQIQDDGNIQVINKKVTKSPLSGNVNQKILNQSLNQSSSSPKKITKPQSPKPSRNQQSVRRIEPSMLTDAIANERIVNERIVVLNQNEFLYKGNSSIGGTSHNTQNDEYIISDMLETDSQDNPQTLDVSISQAEMSPEMTNSQLGHAHQIHQNVISSPLIKKSTVINQPYQIVVSSEQEYKALMAANPAIIFQDASQSKALSVMAHSSNMTPEGIDLDPSQNSNMMIIQNDYPINVSDTLTGDNSNIVVVYSHPLDEQSMQYSAQQLVQTTQEQLVQSSQVIPSIRSVPLMDSAIMAHEEVQQWENPPIIQNTVETLQDAQPISSHITMQDDQEPVHSTEEVISAPTVVDKGLTELAELQILGQNADVMTEVVVSQPSEIQSEELQETVAIDQTDKTFNPEMVPEKMVCDNQEIPEPVPANNEEVVLPQDQNVSEMEVESQEETSLENTEIISSVDEPLEVDAPNGENFEASTESETSQELPEDQSEVESLKPKEVSEQIKNLAAEWSDDESSKFPEETVATSVNETVEGASSSTEKIAVMHGDVEESIENIQQEMDNQVSSTPPTKRIIITSDITIPSSTPLLPALSDAQVIETQATESKSEEPEVAVSTRSKISSLLNDWDDNDSQPESNGGKSPEKVIEEPHMEPEPKQGNVADETDTPVEEKLKSLDKIMSDWDDEEEKEE